MGLSESEFGKTDYNSRGDRFLRRSEGSDTELILHEKVELALMETVMPDEHGDDFLDCHRGGSRRCDLPSLSSVSGHAISPTGVL